MTRICHYPGCYYSRSVHGKRSLHYVPSDQRVQVARHLQIQNLNAKKLVFCSSHFSSNSFLIGKDGRLMLRRDVPVLDMLRQPMMNQITSNESRKFQGERLFWTDGMNESKRDVFQGIRPTLAASWSQSSSTESRPSSISTRGCKFGLLTQFSESVQNLSYF